MKHDRRVWAAAVGSMALLALAVLGCGKAAPQRPPLFPATGKVSVGGKPAAGVSITFHPLGGDASVMPTATSAADGSFTTGTYAPGDGMPQGSYVVTFAWLVSDNPDGDSPMIDRLAGRYVDPARSQIKVEIKSEPNTLAPFLLK